MRIQFCHNCTAEFIAEFEVSRAPTTEEAALINADIEEKMNAYEKEHDGDFTEFDFWQCCHDVAAKHIELVVNPVVTTFYV